MIDHVIKFWIIGCEQPCISYFLRAGKQSWSSHLEPRDRCLTLTVAQLPASPAPLLSRPYVKKKEIHLKSVVWSLLLQLNYACKPMRRNVFSSSSFSSFSCSSSLSFSSMTLFEDFHYFLLAYYSNNLNQCIFFCLSRSRLNSSL